MINMACTQEIVDAIHGSIPYSGIEREIIGTPIFNRLHRILQGSLVYLTYPANKVKRFEHSIGTMHLAGQFFFRSICNSCSAEANTFFEEINQELCGWNNTVPHSEISFVLSSMRQKYSGKKILGLSAPDCLLYRQNTPANLDKSYQLAYYVTYQSIRLVGLLHDVGHLPYSHVLEHALQHLYNDVSHLPELERNPAHNYFLSTMKDYCAGTENEIAIHEELGKLFVEKIFESIIADLPKAENSDYYFLAAVKYLTQRILAAPEGENSIFSDLHRIVASTLDCDRMDYCCRDEICSGISKDVPNYSRIFSAVAITYQPPAPPIATERAEVSTEERSRCLFVFSTKALKQIEGLLQKRWDIYATINYHHRVHKHELLLESVLSELGMQEMSDGNVPDSLENVLPLKVSSIWQLVAQMKGGSPIEYIAIQLDDSWLDTLLKHKYFDKYGENYLSMRENHSDTNWHRLDELISTKKHYHSLIKRSGGFRKFDEILYSSMLGESDMIKKLQLSAEESYAQFINKGEYLFNYILRTIAPDKAPRRQFFDQFNQAIQNKIGMSDTLPFHIANSFLGDCTFSPGIHPTDLYILSTLGQSDKPKPFSHYSALSNILKQEKKLMPSFHIYYLAEFDTSHGEYFVVDVAGFQQWLAAAAVDLFRTWLFPQQPSVLARAEVGRCDCASCIKK